MTDAPGFREFLPDPQAPSRDRVWHDTCGEYALDFALALSDGTKATPKEMLDLTHDMVAHHEHDGGTTLRGLADEAKRKGHTPELFFANTAEEYHQKLLSCAGVRPVVILFQLAQNLVDTEGYGYSYRTPWHQDLVHYALHGHYICVLDKESAGYKVADGAHPLAGSRFAVYRWDVLAKCEIAGFLILEAPKVQAHTMDYGNQLGQGFKALAAQQNKTVSLVIPETYYNDNECFCLFADGAVYHYDSRTGKAEDGKAALVVQGLFEAWQAAKKVPAVNPNLTSAVANTLNALAPFVNAFNELEKVAK